MSAPVIGTVENYEDILECLVAAILKLDEARGIAATEFGDNDRRTKAIEDVWAEAYSLRQWAMESIKALTPPALSDPPADQRQNEGQKQGEKK